MSAWALTTAAARKLGARTSAYVNEHGYLFGHNRNVLVADTTDTPRGVARTLTRVYGQPETIDRGEVAYWAIAQDDFERHDFDGSEES